MCFSKTSRQAVFLHKEALFGMYLRYENTEFAIVAVAVCHQIVFAIAIAICQRKPDILI